MRDYIDLFDGAASNIWQNKQNGKNILLGELITQLLVYSVLYTSIGNVNLQ